MTIIHNYFQTYYICLTTELREETSCTIYAFSPTKNKQTNNIRYYRDTLLSNRGCILIYLLQKFILHTEISFYPHFNLAQPAYKNYRSRNIARQIYQWIYHLLSNNWFLQHFIWLLVLKKVNFCSYDHKFPMKR